MFTLTLDKNTGTQRTVKLSSFSEDITNNVFTGTVSEVIISSSNFSKITGDWTNTSFTTISAVADNGGAITINGSYNRVAYMRCTYDSDSGRFGISVSLEKVTA